jgi:hypothetical protein
VHVKRGARRSRRAGQHQGAQVFQLPVPTFISSRRVKITNRFKTVPRTATRIVVAQDLNATQLSVTGQRLRGRQNEGRTTRAIATANSPVTCVTSVEGQQAEHGHQMIHREVPLS